MPKMQLQFSSPYRRNCLYTQQKIIPTLPNGKGHAEKKWTRKVPTLMIAEDPIRYASNFPNPPLPNGKG